MAPLTIPSVMDYAVMAENGSMLNTPPTYGIYIAGLVFQWLKRQGGLPGIAAVNAEKARFCTSASITPAASTATRSIPIAARG
jgi:phosphoserine aminotransferase